MKTIFGELNILINNLSFPYRSVELNNKGKNFIVDKRYKIICDIPLNNDNIQIECKINFNENLNVFSSPNTGEDLALIDFTWREYRLSIGTIGDLPNINYQFTYNSIIIIGHYPFTQLILYVAWMRTISDEEKNYTWFAADPTLLQ